MWTGSLCATSSGTEKGPAPLFDKGCRYRFRGIPDVLDCSGIIKRLLYHLLDALKRHQTETAAELDALLPAVLERAFRGELQTSVQLKN